MDLSPRKQAVLAAVIKAYIETGEPIGSKILNGLMEQAPSPATLRNEMSELCELGFLKQPHTSAGRIPTPRGYRLYVDALMKPPKLSDGEKAFIDFKLNRIHCDPEQMPAQAGRILSELTGLPTISFYTAGDAAVKKVELTAISPRAVFLSLITTDGRARSRMFRCGDGFSEELYNRFCEIADRSIIGRSLADLSPAYLQSVAAQAGIDALQLLPLLTALFEMAGEIDCRAVDLWGEAYLYRACDTEEAARQILSLIGRTDPIADMFESVSDKAAVIFGNDTDYKELLPSTLIAAGFHGGEKYRGAVGVIGIGRMPYEQIIPGTEYIAQKLTEMMSGAMKDMED